MCFVCTNICVCIVKKAYLPRPDVSLTPQATANENRDVRVDGKDHN